MNRQTEPQQSRLSSALLFIQRVECHVCQITVNFLHIFQTFSLKTFTAYDRIQLIASSSLMPELLFYVSVHQCEAFTRSPHIFCIINEHQNPKILNLFKRMKVSLLNMQNIKLFKLIFRPVKLHENKATRLPIKSEKRY